MPFELRPGQGTLHLAEKKHEQAPDYTGQLNIDGTVYRLAGWRKTSKNGDKWLSLNCELPRQKAVLETPPAKPVRQPPAIDPESDLPF